METMIHGGDEVNGALTNGLNSDYGSDAGMMGGQIQTIRYQRSLAVIRAEGNAVNGMSSIVSDEHSSIAREDSGVIRRSEINNGNDRVPTPAPPPAAAEPSQNPSAVKEKSRPRAKGRRKKLMKRLKYPKKWLEDTRGILMVVATVISTMTFQAVVNPPGGVCPLNNTHSSISSGENVCESGTAVLGNHFSEEFLRFMIYNTVSFLASVSVTLLLVSGYPLHNRICLWLLSMAMCVTLTFMALTYLQVLYLVVPFVLFDSFLTISQVCFKLWIGLLAIVSVMNTIRFIIWVVKKLRPAYFRSKSGLRKILSSRSFCRNV